MADIRARSNLMYLYFHMFPNGVEFLKERDSTRSFQRDRKVN